MIIFFAVGSISNAEWTGVRVRDLARYIGLDPDKAAQIGACWVTSTGLDYHRKTQMHFETSISVDKAFDVKGDVIVAYAMNGKELPPDHGYPVSSVFVLSLLKVPSVSLSQA
jgi:DMSO/TMAO reductase YedYZ molybdopterin-dependent catalytic subunit